jgi:hypothetical protein
MSFSFRGYQSGWAQEILTFIAPLAFCIMPRSMTVMKGLTRMLAPRADTTSAAKCEESFAPRCGAVESRGLM